MDDTVALEYRINRFDKGGIELSYRITNKGEGSILLLSPLSEHKKEAFVPAPGKAYTFLDEDDVLHITKRLWFVPEETDIFMPLVPFLTRVSAGEIFEETLTTPVPVIIDYPYRFDGGTMEMVVTESAGIAFSIGYVIEEEGVLPSQPSRGSLGTNLTSSYGVLIENQLVLQGDALDLRVPVKDFNR